MKVIGLLSWFEESPSWLSACVAGLANVCDHVVAVDGGYFLFPQARASSGREQHEAIQLTAQACGIGCTIHTPNRVWEENEVGKRDFLFRLASLIAEPYEDWLLWVDADEVVSDVPADLRARLQATEEDVGALSLWWREDLHRDPSVEQVAQETVWPHEGRNPYHRVLYRALPGIGVEHAHYLVSGLRDGERVILRGREDVHELAPFADFSDLRIEHRQAYRSAERKERKQDFYTRRDELGIEALPEDAWLVRT